MQDVIGPMPGEESRAAQDAAQPWPAGPPPLSPRRSLQEISEDRLGFLRRCAGYGDFVPFQMGRKTAVYLQRPDLVETVMVKRADDYSKDYLTDLFHPVLRKQLLLSESDDWLEQRRLTQPLLHPDRMAGYAETMVRLAERMADAWGPGEPVEMAAAMRRLTLEILAETVFDVEVATEAAEAGDIVDQIMDDFNRRVATRSPLPVVLPTLGNLRLLRSLRRLDHLLDGIIDDRRRRGAPGEDLLSRLVRTPGGDGHALTNEEVKLTALPLFFAGHETTAMTLTWTLYLLTRYPEVRQRVLDELDTVLGGRPATNADVRNLPQLGNVVHESLRLYPPGWAFGRMAVRDTRIGPYRVPARTTIFMSPWLLHRDERLYERPLEFDPERWSDGLAHRLHRCAYIPFSTGPRRCPGNTFATVESVVVLATICRRWNFAYEGEHEPVLDPSITLRPRDGLLLRVAGAVDRAA